MHLLTDCVQLCDHVQDSKIKPEVYHTGDTMHKHTDNVFIPQHILDQIHAVVGQISCKITMFISVKLYYVYYNQDFDFIYFFEHHFYHEIQISKIKLIYKEMQQRIKQYSQKGGGRIKHFH